MADTGHFPATRVGDALRRLVARRRDIRRRLGLLALAAAAAAPALVTACWTMPLLLVWNASASAPTGLYAVNTRASLRTGNMVIAWAPPSARSLAAARDYVPSSVPLVKRVAAARGDRVCAGGQEIRIDGRRASGRLRRDPSGRRMPWWSGCRSLGRGEYFLLMDSPLSFDGRYFGITAARDIVGRAVPLWTMRTRASGNG